MRNPPDFTVGVISDTHLPYRLAELPPSIFHIFHDVKLILHAGDVDEIEQLAPLKEIAPVFAVRGNFHLADFSSGGKNLPAKIEMTLAKYKIIVTHGHRTGLMGLIMKLPEVFIYDHLKHTLNDDIVRRLRKQYPEADIVIFGHTHAPYARRVGNTLFFNPGGVAPSRGKFTSVGLLHFWDTHIESQVIPLEPFP